MTRFNSKFSTYFFSYLYWHKATGSLSLVKGQNFQQFTVNYWNMNIECGSFVLQGICFFIQPPKYRWQHIVNLSQVLEDYTKICKKKSLLFFISTIQAMLNHCVNWNQSKQGFDGSSKIKLLGVKVQDEIIAKTYSLWFMLQNYSAT